MNVVLVSSALSVVNFFRIMKDFWLIICLSLLWGIEETLTPQSSGTANLPSLRVIAEERQVCCAGTFFIVGTTCFLTCTASIAGTQLGLVTGLPLYNMRVAAQRIRSFVYKVRMRVRPDQGEDERNDELEGYQKRHKLVMIMFDGVD